MDITTSPLHAGPAAGFDQPFEMLVACHARMEHMLDVLDRLGEHLATHGCDAQARSAAADILRYFDVAAPLHHQDEERHVLPRLRELGLAGVAARLRADHQVMEHDWARMRPDLQAVADGRLQAQQLPAARQRWTLYSTLYRRHLAAEEVHAFPPASAGLSAEQQRAMGEDMARRRGAPYPAADGAP
ncbi:hemerythrin domain-containing protein [Pseudorhodoferax sp.]|uniref:hemerythrin domain-containing protein n=1 Tax=Pseudorhodoferax sp. TaxID=1993553 RepID=UPI0039E40426